LENIEMKDNNIEIKIRKMLKSAGLYYTKNRVLILKVLFDATHPLSQEEVAHQSKKENFDKVTIYRTLESLVKAGLVHKAFMNKRAWHFELAHNCSKKQCHPHFTCTKCGKTHCLPGISLPLAESPYKGFIINRQQVHLEGLCPSCS